RTAARRSHHDEPRPPTGARSQCLRAPSLLRRPSVDDDVPSPDSKKDLDMDPQGTSGDGGQGVEALLVELLGVQDAARAGRPLYALDRQRVAETGTARVLGE